MTWSSPTPEELESLLEALHSDSFGWALSCCDWNEADAEDVLQTTYLKVISGRARYGGRSSFKIWLFGVVRQTSREHRRRARSQRDRARRFAAARGGAEATRVEPGDPAVQAETRHSLVQAMRRLPDKQRQVIHLVFYQDCSVREAAEVMEVSVGTARVHYDRAKKKLRALLSLEGRKGGSD